MAKHTYNETNIDEPVVADLRLTVLGICLIVCILFAITFYIDLQISKGSLNLPEWLLIGNVEDARVMLSSIIQSVSTVLGLVFSVVLLVLSMAATQFGPRLLRRFILDHNGQGTIGLFTATFLFSLLTLIVVRSENQFEFIPNITILVAVILIILSFGSLISFSQSIRKGIQTGNLIAKVTEDLSSSLDCYLSQRKARAKINDHAATTENPAVLRQQCIKEGYPIFANEAGYLQFIDYEELIEMAAGTDTVLSLNVHPGNFIIKGTVVGHLLPAERGEELNEDINEALSIGPNRTLTQDPEFAFAQIVEIGTRALSHAINDTFTGIACVDWLSNNILSLVDLPETGEAWPDLEGHTRIIERPVKFSRIVASAFDMIRESGASNPAILIRLLQNFTRIAPHLKNDEQRAAIMRQVTAIRELVELQSISQTDLNDITDSYNKACEALKSKA